MPFYSTVWEKIKKWRAWYNMSLYYASKIDYLLEDISTSTFDFGEFIDTLRKELTKGKDDIYNRIQKVKVQLEILCPDIDVINSLYEEGVIKSHETEATFDKTKDMIKYGISNLMNKLNFTIDRYYVFKDGIKLQRLEYLVKNEYTRESNRMDIISIEFNLRLVGLRDIVAVIKMWALDEFTFAQQIIGKVYTQDKGKENYQQILKHEFERKELGELHEFLSTDDTEYLQHPKFYEILKTYMFPNNFQGNAEITLDIVKPDKFPTKRRTVSLEDTKMKFHQLLSKNTPYEKYREIVKENDIGGIYLSVRSTNNDILYLLIDIDIPSLLSSMFSRQTIWELTTNIAQAINSTAQSLGLPSFKMIFSGSRGIHLLYAMDYDIITDIEHHVNLPELADNNLLPGITTLKKEKISSLNDKFKFIKSLLQSLLLYTVYKETIVIPPEIRRKLKILHGQQLFRLAVDSKDLVAILLDTSSVNKGVFRLFSPHPISRLVSIPISDEKEEGISERYLTYNNVLEDAKIDIVLEKFDTNEADLFLQKPNSITRDHIQMLLRPDKLYPSFATLLRFGTTYAMRRTPNSFHFWHHFYELRGVYNYIYKRVLNKNGIEERELFNEINKLLQDIELENKNKILNLLRLHLLTDTISFPVFYNCLTTLYYHEFFFNAKSPVFIQENQDYLLELFKNQWEFSNFLTQTENMYSIAVYLIIDIILIKEKPQNLPQNQKNSLHTLERKASALLDIVRHSIGEVRHESDEKEEKLVNAMYFVSAMYFSIVKFLKEFTDRDGDE